MNLLYRYRPDAAIAAYYENKAEFQSAGHFFKLCGQYPKALKLFLQCGEKALEQAIDVVGKAKVDQLTRQLIDFLMGDTDGVPKVSQSIVID